MGNENSEGIKNTTLSRIISRFGFFDKIANYVNLGAIAIFFIMIIITFIDVFMRYVMHHAITGMKEYTEVLLFLMIGLSSAAALANGKHIVVTLITDRFKATGKALVSIAANIITVIFLTLLCYSSFSLLQLYIETGRTHGAIMAIKMWPLILLVTIGFLLTLIVAIKHLLIAVQIAKQENASKKGYLLMFVFTAAILMVLLLLFIQVITPNKGILCLIAIAFMFLLMFMGVPVGYALWIVGAVLISNIRGITTGFAQLATLNMQTTTNYTWSVVAYFLLMGMLCFSAGFGTDIFKCFQRFLSKLSGGVCIVTIAASACLAAVVGDNNAVVGTMSQIAYPEMKRLKYDNKMCMGTLAAGSCLGPLIPPSTGFITYSLLTLVSLGKLFASGIIPGLMLAAAFIITIMIMCKRHPEKGPKGESYTWQEKISTLPGALPIIILFVFVIGGTMCGIFSSTEAGAMGCIGALVIGLIMKRFSFKSIVEAFTNSGGMTGMIFTVIVGAKVFSSGLGWCNLSDIVSGFFNSLNMGPMVTVAVILIIFFICGFFIDLLPLMFVGIPIVWNIVSAMGVDGVWFGCLLVMIINTGVITPPFATILFVMKGLMPEVELKDIFTGVIPFVFATIVVVAILFAFPTLVTFLPNLIG